MNETKKLKNNLTIGEYNKLIKLSDISFSPESEINEAMMIQINNKIYTLKYKVRELENLREKLILRTNEEEQPIF